MELTVQEQTTAFLYSIVLGIIFGLICGVFKFIRIAFCSGKTTVFLCDIVYVLTLFLSVFFFSLAYLYGYIRLYVFIGAFLGIILYRLTLGRIFSKIYCPVISFIKNLFSKIIFKIKKNIKKLLNFTNKILYNTNIKKEEQS